MTERERERESERERERERERKRERALLGTGVPWRSALSSFAPVG
jgi:hypothetical protein